MSENQDYNIEINAQYVKDLSFESPNAPMSLIQHEAPKIAIDVNVNVQKFEDSNFEVTLHVTTTAHSADDKVIFIASVAYAGLFDLSRVDEENQKEALVHFCPTILFPFVRAIISTLTRDGGYPPLMLKPIDFTKLYQEEQEKFN